MEIATKEDILRIEQLLSDLSTPAEKEEVLTPDQAAAFVQVDPDTLYKWRNGKTYKNPLPAYGTGRVIRYLKSDLIAFLKNNPIRTISKAA